MTAIAAATSEQGKASRPAPVSSEQYGVPEHGELDDQAIDCERPELAVLIGVAATVALAERLGGTRLYVPARFKERHRLASIIGCDAAKALCETFGATVIRVPLSRDLRAQHYRAQGYSVAAIALRLGLTESGVRGLFKRLERQGSAQQERNN